MGWPLVRRLFLCAPAFYGDYGISLHIAFVVAGYIYIVYEFWLAPVCARGFFSAFAGAQ